MSTREMDAHVDSDLPMLIRILSSLSLHCPARNNWKGGAGRFGKIKLQGKDNSQ